MAASFPFLGCITKSSWTKPPQFRIFRLCVIYLRPVVLDYTMLIRPMRRIELWLNILLKVDACVVLYVIVFVENSHTQLCVIVHLAGARVERMLLLG